MPDPIAPLIPATRVAKHAKSHARALLTGLHASLHASLHAMAHGMAVESGGMDLQLSRTLRKADGGAKRRRMLTKRIRRADKAFRKISRRMTVVKRSAPEQTGWRTIFKKVRRNLAQGTFPSSLVKKAEALAGR